MQVGTLCSVLIHSIATAANHCFCTEDHMWCSPPHQQRGSKVAWVSAWHRNFSWIYTYAKPYLTSYSYILLFIISTLFLPIFTWKFKLLTCSVTKLPLPALFADPLPGSIAFVGSGSPQKGPVTFFTCDSPQQCYNERRTFALCTRGWLCQQSWSSNEMAEESETQYLVIISDWPITSPVPNEDSIPLFLWSLLYFLQVQMWHRS